ncbi:thiolase domain-containing protein [Candidatus Woesearchaeota archaeon]|jgi:acetyl-CoA C-acetyltransferase|nr:thiolase domain-containing protein [Candidatus Woesearchaeota archaeon]MBT5272610.1 thiolase domain-containing protein [Candidatus Woesearchaeota archaeon]MBT6041753.1 thiolase domain-containing protein [Candidatus Woesearchaeota archaeon]MBT6337162.1 thiolase domain-containing protein [Candidatus Woesearchaeota archaeon]MBT7927818.1 thiolase domain-containing protein [Candidatus Woesearchaeota archaeon]
MEKIGIIGVGATKFGELWKHGLRDLLAESQLKAIEDAGISERQIDMIFTGNMCSSDFSGQSHLGSMAAEILNVNVPSIKVEAACASGSVALRQGLQAIKSGEADIVLVNGVEKMTDVQTRQATTGLMGAGDEEWEGFNGLTFCGLYAMIARAYMHKYKLTREQLAMVSVKNHKHATLNPIAHFHNEITVDQVLNSSIIADPLTLLDCSPITDGGASLILAKEEIAKKFESPIWALGSGQANDTLSLHARKSLTEIPATTHAAQRALMQAKIGIDKIDVTEVHDCFSIAEVMAIEDLGLVPRGDAGKIMEEGLTYFDGKIPVNSCGGLKACGHPIGATGIKQVWEIVKQLRGEAGKRQIHNANIGLTHNVGGTGSTVVVNVFGRERG